MPRLLPAFATVLGPCNFDKIRHFYVRFWVSPNEPALHCPFYKLSHWKTFWSRMITITHLRTLHVCISYDIPYCHHSADQDYARPILEPLLALSGLKEFRLNFTIQDPVLSTSSSGLNLPLSTPTLALIEKIHEAATRPRIESRCFS